MVLSSSARFLKQRNDSIRASTTTVKTCLKKLKTSSNLWMMCTESFTHTFTKWLPLSIGGRKTSTKHTMLVYSSSLTLRKRTSEAMRRWTGASWWVCQCSWEETFTTSRSWSSRRTFSLHYKAPLTSGSMSSWWRWPVATSRNSKPLRVTSTSRSTRS